MTHAISFDPQSNEVLTINLSRALSRLERKILSSPLDPRLRHSSYERAKTSAVSMTSPDRDSSCLSIIFGLLMLVAPHFLLLPYILTI